MTTSFMTGPTKLIADRVDELQRFWDQRAVMAKKWYELIQLKDDLAQDNMESVIGIDPRASFNLASWLLTPKTWSIESFKVGLSDEEINQVTAYEQLIEQEVRLSIRNKRGRLGGSYIEQSIRWFVATGWIALVSSPTLPNWTINAWHPLTVFPHYAPDGTLSEVARKWTLSASEAHSLILREGWILPERPFVNSVTVRQWWVQTPDGMAMATTVGEHLARQMTFAPVNIYCQPAGGLPDNGTIVTDDKWRGEIGQSIVASVMDLQKNYNKMMTYNQQLLRDTANPKWIERTDSGSVVNPEDVNKRGVVWSISMGEDIWPVQAPSVPVDMRTHQFDLRQQTQKITFQDASFGGSDASVFAVANMTDSTRQLLQPFVDTLRDGNGIVITKAADMARQFGQTIAGAPIPDLPDNISLDFQYDIEIPGDRLNRANAARILNPDYRISSETITELLFPEVKSPFEERLRLTTEDVARSEMMIAIKSIREFRLAAAQAQALEDSESANLFTKAADRQEAAILGNLEQPNQPATRTLPQVVEAGT